MPETCVPWINSAAILADRADAAAFTVGTLDRAAIVATDLLYVLSGRKFPGLCSASLRPAARPRRWSLASWSALMTQNYGGFSESWGRCDGDGGDGCYRAPTIDLGLFPVRSIVAVRIDGVTIPANEYRLDESKLLVRTRPTATFSPTQRYGWPTCQNLGLPDTEPNTFAVDLTFGADPPAMGKQAAAAMAVEFGKAWSNQTNRLPQRLTSITRQGVSMAVLDPMAFLDKGMTGIYEVDLFVKTYNPTASKVRPAVWSPDVPRPRRINNPYVP